MPYIKVSERVELDNDLPNPWNVGTLNYCLTRQINLYVQSKGLTYQTINDVLGALFGVELEFYRRTGVPYEQKKMEENGDVFT